MSRSPFLLVAGVAIGTIPVATSADDLLVPQDHATIQAAIDAAESGDRIIVDPGTYTENLVVGSSGLQLRGVEAGRTILMPEDDGPLIEISGADNVTVGNFTVRSAQTGIAVAGSTGVTIANTIFDNARQAAVDVDAASLVDVVNSVFFRNAIGVRRGFLNTEVVNNIFERNETTIASPAGGPIDPSANVSFNCFFANEDLSEAGADGAVGSNFQVGDPLFVDVERGDFHLRLDSPCIDAGTGTDVIDDTIADMGAYGGPFADPRPFPVPRPNAEDTSTDQAFSLRLTWEPNRSYRVSNPANPGSYRVHYRLNASGPPYDGSDAGQGTKPSPVQAGDATSIALDGLMPVVPPASPPELLAADPRNEGVLLRWSAVANAVDYQVSYGVAGLDENRASTESTELLISGLENGVEYHFAVTARVRARYFLAVTAIDNTQDANESDFSEEASVPLGPLMESDPSNMLSAIPQQTIPVPDLPDEGCFIATAAHGGTSAAEVQILRAFRDRYLQGNAAGRWLIERYYEASPPLARGLDARPGLKPFVRAALFPLVVIAVVLLAASTAEKAAVIALATLLGASLAARLWATEKDSRCATRAVTQERIRAHAEGREGAKRRPERKRST